MTAITETPSSILSRDVNAAGSEIEPDAGASLPWFVANTRPQGEVQARAHLERQGFHVFCPLYRKTIRHARQRREVEAPLFPGYIFVQLDLSQPWTIVNGTRGVRRLLAQGERPLALPAGFVETLQRQMREQGVIALEPAFGIGAAVRIVEGPFAELIGTVERLDATGRVQVLLELLGRSVAVKMRCEGLTAAD